MDIFEQIRANKRHSTVLLFLTFALLGVLGGVFGASQGSWQVGVGVAFVVGVIAGLIAWFGGSALVLGVSGAKEISKQDHPRLFNVVEEMTIAAGLPKPPRIYLIADSAPNAFATGRSPDDAIVAITSGLVDKLDRDELQAVMAHELSHVRNFDIRYAMLVAVLVGAIALFCDLFLRSMRFRSMGRSRGGRNQGQAIIMIAALLLAIIAPIAALALRMAISRRREYLADAGSAELTRQPAALARALGKIAADPEPLEAANRATQHLYIVNPLRMAGDGGSRLFATHPPTADRVKRLLEMAYEPRFASAPGAAPGPGDRA